MMRILLLTSGVMLTALGGQCQVSQLPADSGQTLNGLKEGLWTEFKADTTYLRFGSTGHMDTSITLTRETGRYTHGAREGKWERYFCREEPFRWYPKTTLHYLNGLKHGEETEYNAYGDVRLIFCTRHWKNGVEHGTGKMYNPVYPHKLMWVYEAVEGKQNLREEYDEEGRLKRLVSDSTLNGQALHYMQVYRSDGQLQQTGYYTDDDKAEGLWTDYHPNGHVASKAVFKNGLLDGMYTQYHSNGQLWTERNYRVGKLWNILSNFDAEGKPKAIGSLKNGNGTVYLYNERGKLEQTLQYKNGEEVK